MLRTTLRFAIEFRCWYACIYTKVLVHIYK